METLKIIIHIIEIVLFVYLGFASVYVLFFAIAGRIGYHPHNPESKHFRKFAVLIPGYKEDAVIVDVAREALKQNYPEEYYEVIIIADSFQPSTLDRLKELPVRVVVVSFEKSTKAKALNKAMEVIGDEYDIALVLDADNVMEPDFLDKVNWSYERGFLTVQGHRIAKNLNTNMAVLDAVSEEINNHLYRLGHRAVGLSSALIGSGMAFDYHFFKKVMKNINAVGGFDKELELTLLQDRKKIDYLENALVYDEKVQNTQVFENQRRRWLSAQFIYFGRYFLPGLRDLFLKGNIDFMDKVYQMVQPPRILLLGITTIIAAIWTVLFWLDIEAVNDYFLFGFFSWGPVFIFTFLAFILAIPRKFYNAQTLRAVMSLPKGFLVMFFSLFKLKGANKRFIHTQHGTTEN